MCPITQLFLIVTNNIIKFLDLLLRFAELLF